MERPRFGAGGRATSTGRPPTLKPTFLNPVTRSASPVGWCVARSHGKTVTLEPVRSVRFHEPW